MNNLCTDILLFLCLDNEQKYFIVFFFVFISPTFILVEILEIQLYNFIFIAFLVEFNFRVDTT